jgi:hypothetical protein
MEICRGKSAVKPDLPVTQDSIAKTNSLVTHDSTTKIDSPVTNIW